MAEKNLGKRIPPEIASFNGDPIGQLVFRHRSLYQPGGRHTPSYQQEGMRAFLSRRLGLEAGRVAENKGPLSHDERYQLHIDQLRDDWTRSPAVAVEESIEKSLLGEKDV